MEHLEWKTAPEPTLRRLPHYYHFLKRLEEKGREEVSCTHIASEFNLDPTQVRKDLACTGIVGRPKIGYEVTILIEAIASFLGWDNLSEAFLAGVGSLGGALLGYERFEKEYGLKIIAAFDADPAKIGKTLHGRDILPVVKLPSLARRMHIQIGIITVPTSNAQEIADLMVAGGITGIWNFAPIAIQVPAGVIVQNENIASGLVILTRRLAEASKKKT